MKTEPVPEIVEIIDDDADAFGDGSSSQTSSDTGGRARWIAPTAAVALVALVGYSVISTAFTDDTNIAAPTDPLTPQYYVADPPPGFSLYMAEDRDQTGAPASHFADAGAAQLWATSDATGTEGAWFVVSQGRHHATGRNAYRTTVDGIEVVVERNPPSRQSRVSFVKNGVEIEITSRGWLDRQLVRLVRSVSIDGRDIQFANPFFASDHKHILDADPMVALLGVPTARVGYTTELPAGLPDELAERFTITVGADNVVDRTNVLKFAVTGATPFTIGDAAAIAGQSVADPTMSIAQWRDGQRLITLLGNIDAGRLSEIAATVHRTSDEKVRELLDARSSESSQPIQVSPKPIGSGVLGDGLGWSVQVSEANLDNGSSAYVWWISQPGDSIRRTEARASTAAETPSIETFVDDGRTYVLAKVPRSMAGAELHVNPTGLPSTVTPFVDVDPAMADQFAAAPFVEPVPFTAEILDGRGETVASWPTF